MLMYWTKSYFCDTNTVKLCTQTLNYIYNVKEKEFDGSLCCGEPRSVHFIPSLCGLCVCWCRISQKASLMLLDLLLQCNLLTPSSLWPKKEKGFMWRIMCWKLLKSVYVCVWLCSSECVERKDSPEVFFCCCEGNMCNEKIYYSPTQVIQRE